MSALIIHLAPIELAEPWDLSFDTIRKPFSEDPRRVLGRVNLHYGVHNQLRNTYISR